MAGQKGRSGGKREGAGRKPDPATYVDSPDLITDDPDEFLRAAMRNPDVDFKLRMQAALALKKQTKNGVPLGKKEQRDEDAKEVAKGKFEPQPAPSKPRARLAVVK